MKTIIISGNDAGIDAVLQPDRHTHIDIDRTCIIGLTEHGLYYLVQALQQGGAIS